MTEMVYTACSYYGGEFKHKEPIYILNKLTLPIVSLNFKFWATNLFIVLLARTVGLVAGLVKKTNKLRKPELLNKLSCL